MVSIFSPDWRNEILRTMGTFLTQTAADARYLQIANEGQISGIRNWVINGNFTINQRGGSRTPGIGVYGLDRWKGHAQGLQQIIEGLPGGQFTLTWSGGGVGTFGGITAASPFVATSPGGNVSVIVPANATRVSLVPGNATTDIDPFSERHIGQELALCLRYYERRGFFYTGYNAAGGTIDVDVPFTVQKRVAPTFAYQAISYANGGGATTVSVEPNRVIIRYFVTGTGAATINTSWTADAEL